MYSSVMFVIDRNRSVYTQEDTVEKYLYQSDLPAMSEFTIVSGKQ